MTARTAVTSRTAGTIATATSSELDPLRRNAGTHTPYGSNPPRIIATEKVYPGFGSEGFNPDCIWDGLDTPCSALQNLAEAGALKIRSDYTLLGQQITLWEELESVGLGLLRRRHFRGIDVHTRTWPEVVETRPARTEIIGWWPVYDYSTFSLAHQQNPNSSTNTSRRRPSRSNDASNANSNSRRKDKTVGLSPCVKKILENYISRDILDKIRIHPDELPTIVGLSEYVSGPKGAVTWGNDVFFGQGQYDPFSARGIAAIGHEAKHVEQFARYGNGNADSALGKTKFALDYADSYKNNVLGGMSGEEAYENDVLEVEPFSLEKRIRADLIIIYEGRNPCP